MRVRNTLILLGLFAVLLVYVVRVELVKPSESELEAARLQLLDMQPGYVVRLALETRDHRIQLGRDDAGQWFVTEPFVDRANDTRVFGLLEELTPLRSIRALGGGRAEQITYRFDRPTVVVTLEQPTGAGFARRVLRIGRKNPAFEAYYAIVDADTSKTGLVPARLVEEYLTLEPPAFRNQRIAEFEVQDPKLLTILTPTSRIVLERNLETRRWSIVSPVATAADQATVNDLVRRFNTQRIETFVAEEPEDLSAYGLDEPTMSVTIVLENELRETLHVGDLVGDGSGRIYARRGRRPTVFTVSESGRLELMRSLFELREKKLLDVAPRAVEGVAIAGDDGRALRIAREGDGWAEIGGGGRRLRSVPVEQVIQNLTALEARAFPERDAGAIVGAFERPLAVATLSLASGDSVRVAFARHGGSAYAHVQPPGTVARVDDADPDLLVGMLDTPPWVR